MATPTAAAKRSGSSRGKWFFTGVLPIHERSPCRYGIPSPHYARLVTLWSGPVQSQKGPGGLWPESARGRAFSQVVRRIRVFRAVSRYVISLTVSPDRDDAGRARN